MLIHAIVSLAIMVVQGAAQAPPGYDARDAMRLGRIQDEALYSAYREAAKLAREDGNGTARGKLAAVRLREHGELGPMLTKRGDRFTGPSDIPAA